MTHWIVERTATRASLRISSILVGVLGLCPIACDERPPSPEDRGTWSDVGKADGAVTCVGFCNGKAPAGCWCDSSCAEYGDCCPDYAPVCEDGGPGPAGEVELISDDYLTRYYWTTFEPVFRGHDAYVPYAVNVHPGRYVVLDVEVRRYRWSETTGLVDMGSMTVPQTPEAIGVTSSGALMSLGVNSKVTVDGSDESVVIAMLTPPGNPDNTYRGDGNLLASPGDGRLFASVVAPKQRTQIIDTRAFAGWQRASTLSGTTVAADDSVALTLEGSDARLYDIRDPYNAQVLMHRTGLGAQAGALLHRGVAFVATAAGQLSVYDGRTGERLTVRDTATGAGRRVLHEQNDLLFVGSGATLDVFDVSTPSEPVAVDEIVLGPASGIREIHGLSGVGDVLHVWATDDSWGSTIAPYNTQMRVRTLRLPSYP